MIARRRPPSTTAAGRHPRQLEGIVAGLVRHAGSVLLLVLIFPKRPDIVAAAWGVLAVGGGVASLIDRHAIGTTWPWNPHKHVTGSIAFVVFGAAAGASLAWWCRSFVVSPPHPWFTLGAPAVAAIAGAAVATVPIRLDRDLSVSLIAAATMWALSIVDRDVAVAALAAAPAALAVALPVNAAVAGVGYAARTVTLSGAIAGVILGTIVLTCAGWSGWLLLLIAFFSAALTSRLGWARKSRMGIAEEHGGRRRAGNAIANTGIAAIAAVLAVVSHAHELALVAFAAALTAGASDTIASEIGKAWGRRTWSIAPLAEVRPGTPGAMSVEGTIAGLGGAATLAAIGSASGLVAWDAIVPIVAGATAGSILESLLAAAFERSRILNNDALNFINTAFAAGVAILLVSVTR